MLQSFRNWINQPFQVNMDVFHWFLFFGLLIVISTIWRLIMSHME